MTFTQSPLRIVLIEDWTVAAITLECLLEDMGHTVAAVAATPMQAERALKDRRTAPDLVICNAFLVGLPSLHLVESYQAQGLSVVVTSTQSEGDLQALGFDAPYLAQPFTDKTVAQVLGQFADRKTFAA